MSSPLLRTVRMSLVWIRYYRPPLCGSLLIALYAQPLGASTSSIAVLSPTDTEGTINITIVDGVLNATDPEHGAFSAFSMSLCCFERYSL